jgi:hypothetical protein
MGFHGHARLRPPVPPCPPAEAFAARAIPSSTAPQPTGEIANRRLSYRGNPRGAREFVTIRSDLLTLKYAETRKYLAGRKGSSLFS